MEIEINHDNFEKEVLHSELPVLLDFWAIWCGPCKILSPVVSELAKKYAGKLKVGKINVDDNNTLAIQYGVMSIPTLKIFKEGKVTDEMVGAAPQSEIEKILEKYLS